MSARPWWPTCAAAAQGRRAARCSCGCAPRWAALGTRGVAKTWSAGGPARRAAGRRRRTGCGISAATAMLRGGASLTEVGQVLRHARAATTAIYAKVDRAALRRLGPALAGRCRRERAAARRPRTTRGPPGARLQAARLRPASGRASSPTWRPPAPPRSPPSWRWPGPRSPGRTPIPAYLGKRLCVVRGFARHLQAFDPATEVPPARLLPWPKCRAVPYLYSEADIAALMTAARSLRPAAARRHLRDADRACSADGPAHRRGHPAGPGRPRLGPGRADGAALQVRQEPGDARCTPAPSTRSGPTRSAATGSAPSPGRRAFFVSPVGTRLVYITVQPTFSRLAGNAGLGPRARRSAGPACTT